MTTDSNIDDAKAAVSIREMSAQVGLSRQRFMQLVKSGVFPSPLYDVTTKRPFYSEELQRVCLEVRRRNCGVNGKVVMFYSRRPSTPATTARTKKPRATPGTDHHREIIDGLKALGLTAITTAQVAEAIKERFPEGVSGTEPAEVIRAIFLHLRGKNSGENVG